MGKYSKRLGYKKSKPKSPQVLFILLLISTLAVGFYARASPESSLNPRDLAFAQQSSSVATSVKWPSYGQAAYGVQGNDLIAVSDDGAKSVPVASLAKIITVQAVLRQKPLAPGQQGPTITLTQEDVELMSKHVRNNGSVTFVEAGGQITQYQALQTIMLSSSNNMADTLVRWAFGSHEAYVTYANAMVRELGLINTFIADASGFSPDTKSTAHEMTKLGLLYMQNPTLVEIAGQKEADIPVHGGLIKNFNAGVNKDRLLGIKVGDTDQAGRCFIIANVHKLPSGQDIVSAATVIGAEDLATAMKDAESIIKAGDNAYDQIYNDQN